MLRGLWPLPQVPAGAGATQGRSRPGCHRPAQSWASAHPTPFPGFSLLRRLSREMDRLVPGGLRGPSPPRFLVPEERPEFWLGLGRLLTDSQEPVSSCGLGKWGAGVFQEARLPLRPLFLKTPVRPMPVQSPRGAHRGSGLGSGAFGAGHPGISASTPSVCSPAHRCAAAPRSQVLRMELRGRAQWPGPSYR